MNRSRQIIPLTLIVLFAGLFLAPLRASAQEQTTAPIDSTRYTRLIDSCFTAGNRLLSFSSALSKDPHEATTRFNRAKLFVQRKEYKAALTDFALLLSDHPKNELYRYQRAMVYLLTKEYDLAEADLKTIIEENDGSLKARIGYALLETMRGRYDEAERLYAFLTDKLPKNAEVLEGRARMYMAKGMRGFAQSLRAPRRPCTSYPLPPACRAEYHPWQHQGGGRRPAPCRRAGEP